MARSTEMRRREIRAALDREGIVEISELVHRYGISAVTARRDAEALSRAGFARREYGRLLAVSNPTVSRSDATIGVMVPFSNYYFNPVLAGAHDAAVEMGIRLILRVSQHAVAEEKRIIERLVSSGVDGLIVAPTPGDDGMLSQEQEEWLLAAGVPVVLLERTFSATGAAARLDAVYSLHNVGIDLAVEHLMEHGHRDLAMVTVMNFETARMAAAFHAAVARLGLPAAPVVSFSSNTDPRVRQEVLVAVRRGATGFVVYDDLAAMDVLIWLQDAGMRVPEDVSVVSYNDVVAALCDPPLTAVSPRKHPLGHRAVTLLAEAIRGRGDSRWVGLPRRDSTDRIKEHIGIVPALARRASVSRIDRIDRSANEVNGSLASSDLVS